MFPWLKYPDSPPYVMAECQLELSLKQSLGVDFDERSRKGHNIDFEFQRDHKIEVYGLIINKCNTTYERDQLLSKNAKNRI